MNYINTKKIREEFPFFRQNNYIYFDNAATTQKPQIIIDSLVEFYTHKNTNVYRGTSIQAHKTTEEYELSRDTIKNYIDCDKDGEVVWTSGATESINLVASSYLKYFLKPNDEVIISEIGISFLKVSTEIQISCPFPPNLHLYFNLQVCSSLCPSGVRLIF